MFAHMARLKSSVKHIPIPIPIPPQVPKQLHITPLKPPIHRHRYPPYLLQPYINVKEAVHHILSEDWYYRQELLARRLRRQTELIPKEKSTAPGSRMTTGEKYGRKSPGFYLTIEGQLRSLGLGAFKGRAHSGIDVSCAWAPFLE